MAKITDGTKLAYKAALDAARAGDQASVSRHMNEARQTLNVGMAIYPNGIGHDATETRTTYAERIADTHVFQAAVMLALHGAAVTDPSPGDFASQLGDAK